MSHDFRVYLQSEFSRRAGKNSRYSLRAYARALDISPSALSAILHNKRPLTPKMIQRLAAQAGLGPRETFRYLQKEKSAPTAASYKQLENDEFELLANGLHNAILELVKTNDRNASEAVMAKRLRVSVHELKAALERLQRLGLLAREADGWSDLTSGFTSRLKENYTDTARKTMQASLREKAIESIKQDPVELRNHTSMTFAINTKDLPEAFEIIKAFRRQMDQFFSSAEEKDEVYQLAVSLFPYSTSGNGGDFNA